MELLLLSTSSMQEANPTWKCLHKHSPERSVKDSVLLPQTLKKHRSGPRDRSIFFFFQKHLSTGKIIMITSLPSKQIDGQEPPGRAEGRTKGKMAGWWIGKNTKISRGQKTWALVPALPFTSCGTLGKLLLLPAARCLLPL